ncbi:hypothetical protein T11_7524 [Trichinella zimbabwensis]|uniref:Uncharacterized protein n=1 Tax=Trichinella zimbabwensis TaxID=268475 RepID=A0A0V1I3D4_9BILA|nr:hypothetical protein T11_7524 [Trichinella zimbabwensis]
MKFSRLKNQWNLRPIKCRAACLLKSKPGPDHKPPDSGELCDGEIPSSTNKTNQSPSAGADGGIVMRQIEKISRKGTDAPAAPCVLNRVVRYSWIRFWRNACWMC